MLNLWAIIVGTCNDDGILMKVAFEAQVMANNIKSLRSLDKEARLVIEYRAEDDELVANINKLHKPDKTVMVVVMDKEEYCKQ